MKKILLLIIFLFCFGLSYAGLSVDPTVTNIKCEAGSVYKGKYLLRNTYDRDINIIIQAEQGETFSGNGKADVKDWLKFKEYKYFIKAGKTVEIPYTADINKKFKGSLSARISFFVAQEKNQMVTVKIVVPVYVTVNGTENVDYCIDSLSIHTSENKVYYKLVLENKGNVHIRHCGNIEIYSGDKKKLLKTVYIQETVPTYCGEKRNFSEILFPKTELKEGEYVAVFKIRAFDKEVIKEVKFNIIKDDNIFLLIKKLKKR